MNKTQLILTLLVIFWGIGGGTSCRSGETTSSSEAAVSTSTTLTSPYTASLTVIPPVDSDALILSSPFGPRLKASDDYRYDWHRGIDIPGNIGQSIYSIANGTLFRAYEEGSDAYPNGGNVVVIRHDLNSSFTFHDTEITRIYTVYMHLNSFGTAAQAFLDTGESNSVTAGETIGGMGQTGDTDFTHLHFEIRLQTTCSLEAQLADTESACTQTGFDPHINPLSFLNETVSSDDFAIEFESASTTEANIKITSDPSSLNTDGVTFQIFSDELRSDEIYSATLAFELRTGFDATSTNNLDNATSDDFTVDPAAFNSSSSNYQINLNANIPENLWENRSTLYLKATLKTTHGDLDTATDIIQQ